MPRAPLIQQSAQEIENAFYDALARADLEALMALWADEEDIVCIHPNAPRLTGHAAIRASWEAILAHGGVHIRPRQLHAVRNPMSAVHSVLEEIAQTAAATRDAHVLATNVYIKTMLGWRLVAHHASVAPGAAPAEQSGAALLH